MALTTILESKDAERLYQPLLLVDLHWRTREFGSDLYLHWANRPINPIETGIAGFSYNGTTYSGRLLNPAFVAWQVLSANGMGQSPMVNLEVADPDHDLWNTYEGATGWGFRGARITISLVFYDPNGDPKFSSDALTVFQGVAQQPQSDEGVLRLSATSMLNLHYRTVPYIRVQKRCPWLHPETDAERAQAEHFDSPFYPCGRYMLNGSEDDGSACHKTRADCKRLGRLDDSTVGVGRFGGSIYQIQKEFQGKDYQSGKMLAVNADTEAKYGDFVPYVYGCGWVEPPILSIYGEANYTRYELLVCYGETVYQIWDETTGWAGTDLPGALTNAVATPIPGVGGWQLIINEHDIPLAPRATVDFVTWAVAAKFKFAFWNFVTGGARNGTACRELGFVNNPDLRPADRKPLGDPYGSLTVLYASVVTDIASSESRPSARVLCGGPLTRRVAKVSVSGNVATLLNVDTGSADVPNTTIGVNHYGVMFSGVDGLDPEVVYQITSPVAGPPGTFTITGGSGSGTGYVLYMGMDQSPSWAVFDLLMCAGYGYADLDFDSFISVAAKCAVKIGYTDAQGTVHSINGGHARYKCNLTVRDPTAVGTLVEGVLNACNSMLVMGDRLKIRMREPLASQQPAGVVIPGSNDATDYPGLLTDGQQGSGRFAYVFDESNIAQGDDGKSSLIIAERSLEDAPNALTFQFSDEDNKYRVDSVTVVDERDVQRTGQLIPANMPVLGVPNGDQAQRTAWTNLALRSRGNPRYQADRAIGTSGTWIIRFRSTTRIIHLKTGDLIGLRSQRYNLGQGGDPPQAFRVIEIKPQADFASIEVTAEWHEDEWHTRLYGQSPEAGYSNPGHNRLGRGPWAWQPRYIQAPATDRWNPGAYTFGLTQTYVPNADGTVRGYLNIWGFPPVNEFAPPDVLIPYISSPPYAVSGGTIPLDTQWYIAVCAKTAANEQSLPEQVPSVCKIAATGSNQTVRIPGIIWHGGTDYNLYAGPTPSSMTFQQTGVQTGGSIDLTAIQPTSFGPPDSEADRFFIHAKRVRHSGVWGQPVDDVESNWIQIIQANWGINHWTGRTISILGKVDDTASLGVLNFLVVSNTSDTLILEPTVDLVAEGVVAGDAVVMRARATNWGPGFIEDSEFANNLAEPYQILWAYGNAVTNEISLVLNSDFFEAGDQVRVFGAETTEGAPHGMNGTWTITKYNEFTVVLTGSNWVPWYENGTGFVQIVGMRASPAKGDERGLSVLIIEGTGKGQSRQIVSNTNVRLNIAPNWDTEPDATSVFIVEDQNWQARVLTDSFHNKIAPNDPAAQPIKLSYQIDNRAGQMYRVEVGLQDSGGTRSVDNPSREIWISGFMGAGGANGPVQEITEKDRATFGIGIGGAQNIGWDLTNHFMVRQPDGGGQFIEALGNCKSPSSNAVDPLIIDIWKSSDQGNTWASIFPEGVGNKLVIPVNDNDPAVRMAQVSTVAFANPPNNGVSPGDLLIICLLGGSDENCRDIQVVVRWG